jgi:enoyl-CoA hydratase
MNIAIACDLVFVSPTARMIPSFIHIGLHPGGGASWLLTNRIGYHQALAVLLEGEPIVGARAVELGLAEGVSDDPVAHALDLARAYAVRDPDLVVAIKRSLRLARTSDLETSIEIESWAQAASLTTPQFRAYVEGVRSRRTK